MKKEVLLKVIELYQLKKTTYELTDNKEKYLLVEEAGNSKKNKLNHQQDYRATLRMHLKFFSS